MAGGKKGAEDDSFVRWSASGQGLMIGGWMGSDEECSARCYGLVASDYCLLMVMRWDDLNLNLDLDLGGHCGHYMMLLLLTLDVGSAGVVAVGTSRRVIGSAL